MCSQTLLYVDDRPSTLSNRVFERTDYGLILLRREDQALPEKHLDRTKGFSSYYRNPARSPQEEAAIFKAWCKEKGVYPTHLLNPSEPEQYFSHAFGGALGLSTLTEEQVGWLRNKVLMKDKFRELGFQTANYAPISSSDELIAFAEENGWPVVLKPQEGFACIETYKISSLEEARKVNWSAMDKWMAESFLEGSEWECCALIKDGKVIDTYLSYMPARPLDIVDGAINANITVRPHPKDFPVDTNKMVQRLVDGMHLDHGYMHMEFFVLNSGNYYLGETALRLAGCEIPANHGYACSFSIFDALIDIHLGRTPNMKYGEERCVGDLLLPIGKGYVVSIPSREDMLSLSGAIEFKPRVAEGDYIDPRRASHTCSGVVHIEGNTVFQVEERMKNILGGYRILQTPTPSKIRTNPKFTCG